MSPGASRTGTLRPHAGAVGLGRVARVAALTAAVLAYGLAQPPAGVWIAAWVVPGLVLAAVDGVGWRAAAIAGTGFGLGAAAATVPWAIDAALVYFDASRLAATAFLVVVWMLLVAPWYGATVAVHQVAARRLPSWSRPLLAGWVWAAGEWVRGALGLPWCLLAHTQTSQLPIIQVADLGGAYAVTFVMAASSAAVAGLVVHGRRALPAGCLGAVVLAAAVGYGRARLATKAATTAFATRAVAVVQGDVTNGFEWERTATARALGTYLRLTADGVADGGTDLIVWPENAVDLYLDGDPIGRLPVAAAARRAHAPLLVGAPRLATDGTARSAAYLLDARGEVVGWHDKAHLVPFAEYRPWPFEAAPDGGLRFGPGQTPVPLPLGGDRFGALICWDADFPATVRGLVRHGASFLVHLSNDAWLDGPSHRGPAQHLAALVFRAVETHRWIARAATTGTSGFVSPTGALELPIGIGEAGVRRHALAMRFDVTPYVRWGDAWLAVGLALVVAGVRRGAVAS